MDIFRGSYRLFDSVSDTESHDIKILEILIKNCNCVGGTNMRGCFLMKLCLIAIFNCAVILVRFLV